MGDVGGFLWFQTKLLINMDLAELVQLTTEEEKINRMLQKRII